jgi:hypothetical protein
MIIAMDTMETMETTAKAGTMRTLAPKGLL